MINRQTVDNQDVITLEVGNNSVSIVKSLGGTIYSLKLNSQEILAGDIEKELTENNLFRGRLLFPFNDRIPDGKYKFNGGEYQFPLNCDGKDSIHGLIYNRVMNEISIAEESNKSVLILETTIKDDEFKGYPFSITLKVTYTLTKDDFSVYFTISNPGKVDAPYALGWHPYFTFGKNINSANLIFGSKEYYDVDENLYYEGNYYSVKGSEFDFTDGQNIGSRELDTAISLSDKAEFLLSDGDLSIKMEFTKELFPALQLFIPDDRNSIAVEPISAPSDTFNYPETGLKIVKPGDSNTGSLTLKLINL